MRKDLIITCVFVFILLVRPSASGDVVHLNNGRDVEGEITEETGEAVTLKIKIGQVVIKKDKIKAVEKKELAPGFFDDTSGNVTHKEGVQAGGQPEAQKSGLAIKAEYKKLSSGDAIVVEGTTNLPPNTVIEFVLKSPVETIQARKEKIGKSPFSVRIGQSSNKKIPPGSYVVEAVFSPDGQEDEAVKEKVKGLKEIKAESEVTVGVPEEVENLVDKRRSELISQIKGAAGMYGELTGEYEAQKAAFNKAAWNARALKWQAKINDIKSSIAKYHTKVANFDFALQESNLNEVAYSLERLISRYTDELFKANNLTYNLSTWAGSKDTETLKKDIEGRLSDLETFAGKQEKK